MDSVQIKMFPWISLRCQFFWEWLWCLFTSSVLSVLYGVQDTAYAVNLARGVDTTNACGHKRAVVSFDVWEWHMTFKIRN